MLIPIKLKVSSNRDAEMVFDLRDVKAYESTWTVDTLVLDTDKGTVRHYHFKSMLVGAEASSYDGHGYLSHQDAKNFHESMVELRDYLNEHFPEEEAT